MTRFGIVESDVVLNPQLSIAAKGMYAIIALYCGDKTYAWPSIETLMEASSLSRPSVQRLLKELKDQGCITRSRDSAKQKTYTHKTHVQD